MYRKVKGKSDWDVYVVSLPYYDKDYLEDFTVNERDMNKYIIGYLFLAPDHAELVCRQQRLHHGREPSDVLLF